MKLGPCSEAISKLTRDPVTFPQCNASGRVRSQFVTHKFVCVTRGFGIGTSSTFQRIDRNAGQTQTSWLADRRTGTASCSSSPHSLASTRAKKASARIDALVRTISVIVWPSSYNGVPVDGQPIQQVPLHARLNIVRNLRPP